MENIRFVELMSHVSQLEAHTNQFFRQYLPIYGSYSMHRCLEHEIWWFLWRNDRQQTDKTNYFTPCACTWSNNIMFTIPNTLVTIFLYSIHSLSMNDLTDEGAHTVSEALKIMANLQHLKWVDQLSKVLSILEANLIDDLEW